MNFRFLFLLLQILAEIRVTEANESDCLWCVHGESVCTIYHKQSEMFIISTYLLSFTKTRYHILYNSRDMWLVQQTTKKYHYPNEKPTDCLMYLTLYCNLDLFISTSSFIYTNNSLSCCCVILNGTINK